MKLKSLQINYLNRYFDHIYVINLKHAVADRLKVSRYLKEQGLHFEVFEASNGYKGEVYEQYREYNKEELGNLKRFPEYNEQEILRCFHYISSPGVMGHLHTFLRVLRDAKNKKYNHFLILEDDVLFSENFESRFDSFIRNTNGRWKVLLLGASQYGWDTIDMDAASRNGFYHPVSNSENSFTYSTFAIAFNLSIVNELIETVSAFESPVDFLPLGEIYEKYRQECYTIYPNIAMQDVASSTLRGAQNQKDEARKRKWPLEKFDYPLQKPSITIIVNSKTNLSNYYFSRPDNQPFNARLFFYDGYYVRPLHSPELLNNTNIVKCPIEKMTVIPEADYTVTIGGKEILKESDIISFLEYKMDIRDINKTQLEDVIRSSANIHKNRISIVITYLGNIKKLRNILLSIMDQDFPNIEIVVVLRSKEKSKLTQKAKHLISSIVSRTLDANIVVLECFRDNVNIASLRNIGFMHSSGEYICFVDEKDPGLWEEFTNSIIILEEAGKNVGAVYYDFAGFDTIKNYIKYYSIEHLDIEKISHLVNRFLCIDKIILKRETISILNGFDESIDYCHDLDFFMRFIDQFEIEIIKRFSIENNYNNQGDKAEANKSLELEDIAKKIEETEKLLNIDQNAPVNFTNELERVVAILLSIFTAIPHTGINTDENKIFEEYNRAYNYYLRKAVEKATDIIKDQKNEILTQRRLFKQKILHSNRQSDWIKEQEMVISKKNQEPEMIKLELAELRKISFLRHPIKKIKIYKLVMSRIFG